MPAPTWIATTAEQEIANQRGKLKENFMIAHDFDKVDGLMLQQQFFHFLCTHALERTGHNRELAANMLGVGTTTFVEWKKIAGIGKLKASAEA
jgi:hypothetical protein